ncbi:ABC transporter ATP-binding protein [Puniceibacterium sp. IMCC21224]|uniref:ABC transporter ATP-binding protein n=1 Tax=Puniceibacterium sp. IMCC21224 TaxID=1618204 RepID=UPI00064DF995|nr:ABC transporter ATP-binding protein [Puniceibacterium sp. IMCC21224]KMK68849.1 hypothetical protein IMCC21224_113735 [Puniceibacterium sp. IMCC21224]
MQLVDFLEDFEGFRAPLSGLATPVGPAIDLEGEKLESFEEGYRAGWDDAIKAQSDDRTRISSDFAQNLQDLSFTYHEAYSQVLSAMTPLLEEMVNSVLPKFAQNSLGLHILEQLRAKSRDIGALDVEIVVSPQCIEAVKVSLTQDFGFPLQLVEDDSMADGQADIRFGNMEQRIDLSEVLVGVDQALQGFVHENQRKIANG